MAGAGIVFYAGVLIDLVVIVIMIVLISRNAQTIGKKLMGIKIARTDGSRATLARIFWLRYLLNTAISMVPFFGGLYALIDILDDLRRAAALLPRLHRRHDRHPGLNPAIDTLLSAETPEGIAISIRPAGFAVRANAFLIDAVIRLLLLTACATVVGRAGYFGAGCSIFSSSW